MPKKNTSARGGAQRNKPRAQKSFVLVRDTPGQVSGEPELEVEDTGNTEEQGEIASKAVNFSTIVAPEPKKTASTPPTKQAPTVKKSESAAETKLLMETPTPAPESASSAPKGSAAAKLAARRQASQKSQQRVAPALISAEHYAYVRGDLILIAILAAIMFSIIIILNFVPGIGS